MVTFEEARTIAAANYFKQAQDEEFEFEPWVAEWGYENKDFFQVVCGDKRWLVDGFEDLAPVDDIVRLVSKNSGDYLQLSALQMLTALSEFTPVGEFPTNFQ